MHPTANPPSPRPDNAQRAVLYLRQSVSKDDSISLELQESAGRDYCTRTGYDVVAVKADPDRTGRTWRRRPAVAQAIAMLEAGDADVIVLWKWSRLSRNRKDWAVAQDRAEVAGGRIESATEPVDVTTAAGRFSRGVLIEMAVFDSERIGETWREVHARRLKAGLPGTGKPRWGYTYERGAGFTPDPVLGPILADLYRRYTTGQSAEHLVEWLNVQHIPTITGGTWEAKTLLRMLDTGFGAGRLRRHNPQVPCPKKPGHCAVADHMEWLDGIHTPVITTTEWVTYREQRKARGKIPPRTKGSIYPFSGLVHCARCGGPMYPGQYGARREPKYRCATRARRGPSACQGGYVMAHYLAAAVRGWLSDLVGDADQLAKVTTPRPPPAAARIDGKRLEAQIRALDTALTRATVNNAKGLTPDDAYAAARDEITAERDALAEQLAALGSERDGPMPGPEVYRGLLREWDTMDAMIRRESCRRIIARVEVRTGRPRADIHVVPRWPG